MRKDNRSPREFAVLLWKKKWRGQRGKDCLLNTQGRRDQARGKTHDTPKKPKRSKSTRICHGRGGCCCCCDRDEHLRVPVRTGHPTDDSNGIPKRITDKVHYLTIKPEILQWPCWREKVSYYLREETMLRIKKITKRAAHKRKGQSTVEYIILVAAVIGAILIFSGSFRTAFKNTLESGTNGMENMANRLQTSRPTG